MVQTIKFELPPKPSAAMQREGACRLVVARKELAIWGHYVQPPVSPSFLAPRPAPPPPRDQLQHSKDATEMLGEFLDACKLVERSAT